MPMKIKCPESFVCAGCKEEFTMTDALVPHHLGNITQEDVDLMCEGEHPQYGMLCDECMSLYLHVAESETLH